MAIPGSPLDSSEYAGSVDMCRSFRDRLPRRHSSIRHGVVASLMRKASVTGFIVFMLSVPIVWKSKGQGSVTLSSSEAEFYALSEAAKDIRFVAQILLTMGIPVRLPIVVRVDNVGAIFMSENVSASSRTKHIDIRYNFVREFVADKFIKIIFMRTEENVSDGFTKNVSGDIYEKHCKEFIANRDPYLKSDEGTSV
jgi:hypothetical protein